MPLMGIELGTFGSNVRHLIYCAIETIADRWCCFGLVYA